MNLRGRRPVLWEFSVSCENDVILVTPLQQDISCMKLYPNGENMYVTFRQRPDIAPVEMLLHYDVIIKWSVKWLRNCDVTMDWHQKVYMESSMP